MYKPELTGGEERITIKISYSTSQYYLHHERFNPVLGWEQYKGDIYLKDALKHVVTD